MHKKILISISLITLLGTSTAVQVRHPTRTLAQTSTLSFSEDQLATHISEKVSKNLWEKFVGLFHSTPSNSTTEAPGDKKS
jgi:hypothetical protein